MAQALVALAPTMRLTQSTLFYNMCFTINVTSMGNAFIAILDLILVVATRTRQTILNGLRMHKEQQRMNALIRWKIFRVMKDFCHEKRPINDDFCCTLGEIILKIFYRIMKLLQMSKVRLLFLQICVFSFLSGVHADNAEVINNIKSAVGQYAGEGRAVLQLQYEVDLDNGVLWVRQLEMNSQTGDFLITLGKLPESAILEFYSGKVDISKRLLIRAYASIGGLLMSTDLITGKWQKAALLEISGMLARHNYFNLNSCEDYLAEIAMNEGVMRHVVRTHGKIEFARPPWNIVAMTNQNGAINSWTVTKDGVVVRQILNQSVPLFNLTINELPQVEGLPTVSPPDKLFDPLIGKVGIGLFFQINNKGDIVVSQVLKESPAFNAGIKVNDVVKQVNGTLLEKSNLSELKRLIDLNSDQVEITLFSREGYEKVLTVKKQVLSKP